jgi:hypothetical protein
MAIGKRDPKELQEQVENHRDNQRLRQYKAAKLVFNDDQSVIDCVLRDLSSTGARVKVDVMADFPEELVLKISNGVTYSADVMWRRGDELGLHFHGDVKLEMTGKVSSVRSVLDMAKALQVERLLRALETYHDFSDDEVKYATQEFGAAYEVMIETLRKTLHDEEKKLQEEGE